eukprot:1707402-Alexandrium_andersonii.AAC.1
MAQALAVAAAAPVGGGDESELRRPGFASPAPPLSLREAARAGMLTGRPGWARWIPALCWMISWSSGELQLESSSLRMGLRIRPCEAWRSDTT